MTEVTYHTLEAGNDEELHALKTMISDDLSEPYSIYVYHFFLSQWPELCNIAKLNGETIGVIICKIEPHRDVRSRGYIGMLAVKKEHRGHGIAKKLVRISIEKMIKAGCDEIMLETEVVNKPAIALYEHMGFIRSKRLYRYYLNQHDAFRLILPITSKSTVRSVYLQHSDQLAT
ncbi:peptide alpha-N-acetyltransferase MAK3 [Cyberlindnera jadinii NRRL Y-1542]|uniref:Acyl-CoA N-acyltransferase n=1 Tax=Cyberlindnera jadinii (strain ATCC 18201 / CBS 1600 / BCRC 20928 / JCM 3617 / NBRC 0987 / NRRL Y-1542) TaxID=983966 RepID=A0A1E4S461_CYBJN|nr:acyl-CoA N-acyltransferase [Cyberlindnera jadinii NRRL Y-1542]ODV74316.1 acyl-CoA N-acyltransferase [Cyberlindnera jadinii NRRL Y-1542]